MWASFWVYEIYITYKLCFNIACISSKRMLKQIPMFKNGLLRAYPLDFFSEVITFLTSPVLSPDSRLLSH
jgi:hypothetical protein